MIQLANDPNASRSGWRPTANDGKPAALDGQRGRSAHAWPFLSRYAARPVPQDGPKNPSNESGS
jgi:hypothetical protein